MTFSAIRHRGTPPALLLIPNSDAVPPAPESALLGQVNATINQRGRSCPDDVCLEDWPEAANLERIDYWDCKAYAVAKADRLIHERGYDPARLENIC